MTIIDAHQHAWDPRAVTYDWLTGDGPLNRPILWDELVPHLERNGIDATVLVQSADNDEDTDFMLAMAAEHPQIAAVVGFVPLHDPAAVAADLTRRAGEPLIVGYRNLIHTRPDVDWLVTPAFDEGLGLLEAAGMSFDVVGVLPEHLAHVPTLSERHPRLRMVLDHLNKPPIGDDDREPWWSLIAAAAENPNVYAKISGLYSAVGDPAAWTPDLVRPYVDRALDLFGPERLMYGGDWPISTIAGGYDRVWDGLQEVFADLAPRDRERIFGETAIDFYQIDPARLAALEPATR